MRVAGAGDAASIAAIYAPHVRDSAVSFEEAPPDADEMGRRIARTLERLPWLVAERDGRLAGYAYAAPHRERAAYRWSVEVSAYVTDGARRGGAGRALYAALLGALAAQGHHRAYAGITLPNPASVAFHEALGFSHVGSYREVGWKLGAWRDVGWWERALAAPGAAPEPPLAFAAWRRSAAGRRLLGEP